MVSFRHRHLAAICYEVMLENAAAPVVISSEIVTYRDKPVHTEDPRQHVGFKDGVLVTKIRWERGMRLMLCQITKRSGMRIACGADHVIETGT